MEKHPARVRTARIGVRVSAQDQREIEIAAKAKGYSSPSAFIRTAIRNELHGREELIGIEERIGGSFERLSSENMRLSRAVQAEKKVRRHLMRARKRKGFGWKRWSRQWLYGELGLFNGYRVRRLEPKVQLAR